MFWKHPITKKNRFLPVVHATNGIPSYFDHDLSETSSIYSKNPDYSSKMVDLGERHFERSTKPSADLQSCMKADLPRGTM